MVGGGVIFICMDKYSQSINTALSSTHRNPSLDRRDHPTVYYTTMASVYIAFALTHTHSGEEGKQ